jgi:uncharacterized BrkB/YihY/UPF0761 family membrane protein
MARPETENDGEELNKLSDVYTVLTTDAKEIIRDLKGGVLMWREAAAGAAASAGFIIILILTAFRYYPPSSIDGWVYVIGAGILAVVMALISANGFRKYFMLEKKYASLFRKADEL